MFYRAVNRRTGEVIAKKVRIAQDFKSRSVGLLNRQSMGEDEGLLIKPCNSIHTFFMKFPIDVLFLSESSAVVKAVHNIGPFRLSASHIKGYMTLELAAGVIQKFDIKTGDIIEIML